MATRRPRARRLLCLLAATLITQTMGVVAGLHWSWFSDARANQPTASATAVMALFNTRLPDLQGRSQPLAIYRGKPLVVNFWAAWCAPCVAEMPELSQLAAHYGSRARFVGISVDTAPNVARFLAKVKVDFPIYVAGYGGGDLARALGNDIGGLPYTVVIDASGTVRYTKLGSVDLPALQQVLDNF